MTPSDPDVDFSLLPAMGAALTHEEILIIAALLDSPFRTPEDIVTHLTGLIAAYGEVPTLLEPDVSVILGGLEREDMVAREWVIGEVHQGEAWQLTGAGFIALVHGLTTPVSNFSRQPLPFLVKLLLVANLHALGRDPELRRLMKKRQPGGRLRYILEARRFFPDKERFKRYVSSHARPDRLIRAQLEEERRRLSDLEADLVELTSLQKTIRERFRELAEGVGHEALTPITSRLRPSFPLVNDELLRGIMLKQVDIERDHLLLPYQLKLLRDIEYLEALLERFPEEPPAPSAGG